MSEVSISVYHDTRRKKENDLFPVKLRVYYNKETRLYPINLDLSIIEFKRSYQAEKPRQDYKDLKMKIVAFEIRANSIVDGMKTFSFDIFERKYLRDSGAGKDAFYYYSQAIEEYKRLDQVGTASNHDSSYKSLKQFLESTGKKSEKLLFETINAKFLNDYERWMHIKGKSISTVGIYLRPLRAIFNAAIAEGEIEKEIYPFGKKQYQIPAGQNIKKALSKEELKKLFEFQISDNKYREKARDFWFFTYVCNGMNIRDIADLKYKNLTKDDTMFFYRNKSKNTSKTNLKPIIVPLNSFAKEIIKKYGNKKEDPNTYIFPIFTPNMTASDKKRVAQNFTRFVNQHIKKLAEQVGLDGDISTYWARHSFATMSILNGQSLEFVQDTLGHNSKETTVKYFKGFDTKVIAENANKLIDF